MPHGYPILLRLAGRRVVLVGGGKVATRKVSGLIEAGADDIVAIAPAFDPALPAAVRRIESAYTPAHLDGAALVFAVTDSADVNAQVVRDARARGIWVGRADADETDERASDFVTPAKLREPNVLLTVSAASAALSIHIRDHLRKRWDSRWTTMADAMTILRPWVRGQALSQEKRAAVFRTLASDAAMDVLADGDVPALRAWVCRQHPELNNDAPGGGKAGGRSDA